MPTALHADLEQAALDWSYGARPTPLWDVERYPILNAKNLKPLLPIVAGVYLAWRWAQRQSYGGKVGDFIAAHSDAANQYLSVLTDLAEDCPLDWINALSQAGRTYA